MRLLTTCILLLTLLPVLANASQEPPTMREWYAYVQQTAEEFNLDPNLCAALAAGESGIKGKEVRFCWVGYGQYLGPYNLHRDVVKEYGVTDWKSCTRVGIMLLARKLKKYGSLWGALRHYNTGDGPIAFRGYVRNIEKLRDQYEEKGTFRKITLAREGQD